METFRQKDPDLIGNILDNGVIIPTRILPDYLKKIKPYYKKKKEDMKNVHHRV